MASCCLELRAHAAETRALAFTDLYGEPFGLTNRADVRPMGLSRPDALGQEHVRLQQVRDGVPVTAGELIVHLRGNRVVAANGRTLKDVAVLLTPSIAPGGSPRAGADADREDTGAIWPVTHGSAVRGWKSSTAA